jgi:hypothetical protein
VFPARYELNSYIVFRKRLVSKRLRTDLKGRTMGSALIIQDIRIIFILIFGTFTFFCFRILVVTKSPCVWGGGLSHPVSGALSYYPSPYPLRTKPRCSVSRVPATSIRGLKSLAQPLRFALSSGPNRVCVSHPIT